ncbi:MAG TPA: MoaD/ThiS family protein [Kineosporiaceae bacterium]|nr:MoaD/ThiS family protein [Kineosporiaceae bacterium]
MVRYYAGARAAAGVDEEVLDLPAGATVTSLVDALAHRHGPTLARVLAACSFVVDEVAGGRERSLDGVRQVDVLPPFAGG